MDYFFDAVLQRKGRHREQKWKVENPSVTAPERNSALTFEAVTSRLGGLDIAESSGDVHSPQLGGIQSTNHHTPFQGEKAIWKPRAYGTASGPVEVDTESKTADKGVAEVQENSSGSSVAQEISPGLSKLFRTNYLEGFSVDNNTYTSAQIRATFYPKFENEKSDQEVIFISKQSLIIFLYQDVCLVQL